MDATNSVLTKGCSTSVSIISAFITDHKKGEILKVLLEIEEFLD
jgi:hypothetical protein